MITLLIPTINRSDFLIRQLNYYRDVGFQGCICIGDSSDTVHTERTKRALKAFQGSLNVIYREYPHLNDAACLQQLLDFVVTPYAAFVADDDFLVPTALEQCALFLDKHCDYSAAHGMALAISLKSSGAYGQVAWARPYELPVIEAESAAQRILAHLNNYAVTLFSVHRIGSWREMYRDISLLADKTFASELLPCCLSVIKGKVKELDCLYLVRQDHAQRYLLPGKRDWIRNPNWPSLYQVFCSLLAKELAKQDRVSADKAQEIVEQAFGSYMTKLLGEQWQNHCGQGSAGTHNRLRQVARLIPGALRVWRALHSLRNTGARVEIPLAVLLNPSSSYYAEIMPIYRALTAASVEFPEETS